jgi:hypothetical protein
MSFITFESFQPEDRQSFEKARFIQEPVEKLAVSLGDKALFRFPSPQVIFLHIKFRIHEMGYLLDYYGTMFPNVTHLILSNISIQADWAELFAGFENLESIYDQGFHGNRPLSFAQIMAINKNRTKPVDAIEAWINKSGDFDPNITLPSKLGLNIEGWYGDKLDFIPIIELCVKNVKDLEISGLTCMKSNSQFVDELVKLRDKCERNEMCFLPEVYEDNNYFCEVFETLIKRNMNKSAQLTTLSSEQL